MGTLTVIAVLASIMAFSSLFKLAERLEEENRLLTMSIETSRIYKEALDEKVREIRKFRHDAVGLLQAIDMYDPGSGPGAAVQYRKSDAEVNGRNVRSCMPLLEAIIELKRNQCDEAGIGFACPDEIPEHWTMPGMPEETDLCLLIQNLLENAYEACLRIDDPAKRLMELSLGNDPGSDGDEEMPAAWVRVVNSIDEKEKVSFFTGKSDRELHGIGLRIVDDIVKKYNGEKIVRTDTDEHRITVEVIMKREGGR